MANSLRRDIEENEVLVIKAELVTEQYKDVNQRLFLAMSGFGLRHSARGAAIFGQDAKFEDGKIHIQGHTRMDGYDFDAKETEKWQRENMKFWTEK